MRRKTVLIIDPDHRSREELTVPLRRDYRVLRAASAEAGLELMDRQEVDVVVTESALPGITGFELVPILRENYPLVEAVLVSGQADVDAAVRAIKLGAFHYLPKNADGEALRAVIAHAAERQENTRRLLNLQEQVDEARDRDFVHGSSRAMREVIDAVHKVAKLSATVLILGESGTGKELLARLLHKESGHPDSPFVAVNLAAIPRELVESTLFGHEKGAFTGALQQRLGRFELASGGSLFLDEIGDLQLELQAKLLRAIQEGEIERVGGSKPIRTTFRLIAATHVDLERAVKDGTFRGDLFYRVNVIPIRLPPLRERPEDVPALASFFLQRYNTRFHKRIQGIAASTLQMLQRHYWPGNIRELENLIERVVAYCDHDWVTDEDLPLEYQVADVEAGDGSGNLLDRAMAAYERKFLIAALQRGGWSVSRTARQLGVPLSTLKFKMDRLEVRELARKIKGA